MKNKVYMLRTIRFDVPDSFEGEEELKDFIADRTDKLNKDVQDWVIDRAADTIMSKVVKAYYDFVSLHGHSPKVVYLTREDVSVLRNSSTVPFAALGVGIDAGQIDENIATGEITVNGLVVKW